MAGLVAAEYCVGLGFQPERKETKVKIKRMLRSGCPRVYDSITYNRQKLEAAYESTDR